MDRNFLKEALDAEMKYKNLKSEVDSLVQKLKEAEKEYFESRKRALSYLQDGVEIKTDNVEEKVVVKPTKKISVLKKIKREPRDNQITEEERKSFLSLIPELKKTSNQKLAQYLGITTGAVYCWYKRDCYPRPDTYRAILKYLNK